ncbi:hypothetical protein HMPREF1015_02190 [Bacillus smithii 7_3_47FAA]|uniref:Uncharacterized protein n=1 Tax=Bacillus smithii 7_3_47FAA TaxID=665952 RepID=G9QJ29_9BACI|nr:hypothetical protein HMPREF1015_02190 [Bacillus smithii 7_3_47FAA]
MAAPWGINDVVNLEVKPTPYFKELKELAKVYEEWITKKNWKAIWQNFYIENAN